MFHTVFFYYGLGVAPCVKGTSEDFCKLLVQTSNTETLEVEI